ncbi:chemotaxis protein CheA [Sphingomonas quercus]|uniref:Chemotaxis protein CheA n=1 Tax=Sphingomonas quercus TaxID=2842451 RepID=A0ABS6BGZ6_9SPHN|nr:chemotaxis protein CheA [Sphingomonas quercus]MBU3076510.1 chemotaxis protein CheA [Sphingomonas quercus]
MELDEIAAIFFLECDEGLAAIETHLAVYDRDDSDPETINTIFRAVHSIKGGAGAFGHERLQHFAHHYETVLDGLRNNKFSADKQVRAILFAAFDLLTDHVLAAKGERDVPDDARVLEQLDAVAEGRLSSADDAAAPAPAAPEPDENGFVVQAVDLGALFDEPADSGPAPWKVVFRPEQRALDNGQEPSLLVAELCQMGGKLIAVDHESLPALDAIAADESYLGWTLELPADLDRDEILGVFDFISPASTVIVERSGEPAAADTPAEADEAGFVVTPVSLDDFDIPAAAPAAAPAPELKPTPAAPAAPAAKAAPAAPAAGPSPTIRVELDKLDRLVNLVGELVITQAMLAQRLSESGIPTLDELSDLDHLTRELQDSAMSIRAQPVKSVFSRVPRIIRELESETGKRVRLEVEGEMTEVDKTVVERIGEPLTHMIRNAVDHGLEKPEDRVAAGKNPEGVVRLAAEHRSGRIVISVTDDGRGINTAKVREKAIERGIITADQQLSEEELENLIFAPGFSTAATVSNISGRGVGMDVVRKNVQALGGRILIANRPGQGSTFSLTLPLTLAILDGMIVTVGGQTYVIPLTHIVESLRPQPSDIHHLGPDAMVLNVRGNYLPVHTIGRLLSVPGARAQPTEAVLVVVETDAGRAVLMVDDIQDQRQVVVKSLEANYQPVAGITGATILGDGRVALILDVEGLVARHNQIGGDFEMLAA